MGFQSHDRRQERTKYLSPIDKKTMELLRPKAVLCDYQWSTLGVWCDYQWSTLDKVYSEK